MSNPLLTHRAALCNIVRRIAIEAGQITLEYFDESGYRGADAKTDGSPVTLADHKAEELIEKKLLELLPEIPIIAEEAFESGRKTDLAAADYFWLVDPLDGTLEFIRGSNDYTVNIALIHKSNPVLGVIYAPALGELYAGYINDNGEKKSFRWLEETDKEKDIHVRRPPPEGLSVVASRGNTSHTRVETFLEDYKVAKITRRGSSIKICAIASGKADLYPRLGPTSEWDTAAGDAILRAAGGVIKDLNGNDLRYGLSSPNFENPHFIAASREFF